MREDGTPKGSGFLGLIPLPDGRVASELSITFEIDGREILAPSLIPGLSKDELDFLLQGGKPKQMSDELFKKITNHAMQRLQQGKSPFIEPGEKVFK